MYTVTIPVHTSDYFDVEATLAELKRAKADRVLLAVSRRLVPAPEGMRIKPDAYIDLIRDTIPLYEAEGLEVGVWIGETMGHGGALLNSVVKPGEQGAPAYTPFTSITGRASSGSFCCADPFFRADVCAWAACSAKAGAKLIILDDDWRMSLHGDGLYAGCMCDDHIRRYCELAGEQLTREEIANSVFTGGPSRYRKLWQKLMGGDMLRLAREIREAVDAVNPDCRIGICCAPSVVGLDGSSPMGIAQTLAGKTRPYLRLICAPYWAKTGAELASVMASERLYAWYADEWRRETDAEILLEGDAYPRPRFVTPAAYLECADQICRADKHFTGSMMYVIDYFSTPGYERGYIDKHVKNRELSRKIEAMFEGKRQLGFKPAEYRELFLSSVLPDDPLTGNATAYSRFRGIAPGALANASASISFDDGVTVLFGENARMADEKLVNRGAILDAYAARILTERGFDVGFVDDSYLGSGASELFGGTDVVNCSERINHRECALRSIKAAEGAERLTWFADGTPGVYRYENAEGSRYVVYPINVAPDDRSTYFRAYTRQKELYDAAEYISGSRLPVEITGHPDITVIMAQDENELAVGIWNLFPDSVDKPLLKLTFMPSYVRTVGCSAQLTADGVVLSEIAPFGFAGIILGK